MTAYDKVTINHVKGDGEDWHIEAWAADAEDSPDHYYGERVRFHGATIKGSGCELRADDSSLRVKERGDKLRVTNGV